MKHTKIIVATLMTLSLSSFAQTPTRAYPVVSQAHYR